MAIESVQIASAVFIMVFLASCAVAPGGVATVNHDNWGEANRQTMAAQIIDPSPDYGDTPMLTSGDQVAGALARFRTGQVKQPERTKTSKTATSGSN
jgi:hypothetical protein